MINAQCSIFFGDKATGAWFDCHECYEEIVGEKLDLAKAVKSPLSLVCKNCRKLFQKDLRIFGQDDCACPHCGNAYVVPAMTPESVMVRECEQVTAAALALSLATPLQVDAGLAGRFEHLVDYSELPASIQPRRPHRRRARRRDNDEGSRPGARASRGSCGDAPSTIASSRGSLGDDP